MPEAIQNVLFLFSQEVRKILGEDLRKVIVYGSYARGDYNEDSDVDVMVLTSLAESEIKPIEYKSYDVAFDFLMEHGVDISVIVKTRNILSVGWEHCRSTIISTRKVWLLMDNRKQDLSNYRLS